MRRAIITLAAVALLSGCGAHYATTIVPPQRTVIFRGVPVLLVEGEPYLDADTLAALELAGIDTSSRVNVRALVLRAE
jgi:hypothetical protein